jgi:hypothetical protein
MQKRQKRFIVQIFTVGFSSANRTVLIRIQIFIPFIPSAVGNLALTGVTLGPAVELPTGLGLVRQAHVSRGGETGWRSSRTAQSMSDAPVGSV